MRAQRALGRAGGAGGIEDRGIVFRQQRDIGHAAGPADRCQWAGAPMTSSSTVTPGGGLAARVTKICSTEGGRSFSRASRSASAKTKRAPQSSMP